MNRKDALNLGGSGIAHGVRPMHHSPQAQQQYQDFLEMVATAEAMTPSQRETFVRDQMREKGYLYIKRDINRQFHRA